MSQSRFGGRIAYLVDHGLYPTGQAVSFSDCAKVSLDVYRSTRDFFALHMVTATHAARVCATIVEHDLVLRSLTGALLAAHRALGSPVFDRNKPAPVPDDVDLVHGYKYLYACRAEYAAEADARYLEEIESFEQLKMLQWLRDG